MAYHILTRQELHARRAVSSIAFRIGIVCTLVPCAVISYSFLHPESADHLPYAALVLVTLVCAVLTAAATNIGEGLARANLNTHAAICELVTSSPELSQFVGELCETQGEITRRDWERIKEYIERIDKDRQEHELDTAYVRLCEAVSARATVTRISNCNT